MILLSAVIGSLMLASLLLLYFRRYWSFGVILVSSIGIGASLGLLEFTVLACSLALAATLVMRLLRVSKEVVILLLPSLFFLLLYLRDVSYIEYPLITSVSILAGFGLSLAYMRLGDLPLGRDFLTVFRINVFRIPGKVIEAVPRYIVGIILFSLFVRILGLMFPWMFASIILSGLIVTIVFYFVSKVGIKGELLLYVFSAVASLIVLRNEDIMGINEILKLMEEVLNSLGW